MQAVQNEFIFLVNAYYQAEAYSNGIVATGGMFGPLEIQDELYQFREKIQNSFPDLYSEIKKNEREGKKGVMEKTLLKAKLSEIYDIEDYFFVELEQFISHMKSKNENIAHYRLSFQLETDFIFESVGGIIKGLGNHISLKDGVHKIIDSILNDNYWEGDDIKQRINFIRNLKINKGFSEKWIKEYAFKMFYNKSINSATETQNEDVYEKLVELTFQKNDIEKAKDLALDLIIDGSNNVVTYICLSAIFSTEKNWDRCIEACNEGLKIKEHPMLYNHKGHSYCMKNQIMDGLMFFEKGKKMGDEACENNYNHWLSKLDVF